MLLLRHERTGTPLEVSLAWLPFEKEALARAERTQFGVVEVPVARPEDLVVYKFAAWRDPGRADVERLLRNHGAAMGLGRVRELLHQIAEALGEPGRDVELERMMRRAAAAG